MSTSSRSATPRASPVGRTWKPITMALEVEASSTSLSLMAPTPRWITCTRTSLVESCSSESESACTEPSTSPLIPRFSVPLSPRASILVMSVSFTPAAADAHPLLAVQPLPRLRHLGGALGLHHYHL